MNVNLDKLAKVSEKVLSHKYEELYEEGVDWVQDPPLVQAIVWLFDSLEADKLTLRLIKYWIALVLFSAVHTNIQCYADIDDILDAVKADLKLRVADALTDLKVGSEVIEIEVFSHDTLTDAIETAGSQTLAEGLSFCQAALNCGDNQANFLDMLDLIFEGYAYFPGDANARRSLFEWFVKDLLPAACELRNPSSFFEIDPKVGIPLLYELYQISNLLRQMFSI